MAILISADMSKLMLKTATADVFLKHHFYLVRWPIPPDIPFPKILFLRKGVRKFKLHWLGAYSRLHVSNKCVA